MRKELSSFIEAEVVFPVEDKLMGLLHLLDGTEVYFENNFPSNGSNSFKAKDKVVISKFFKIGKTIIRPTEMSMITPDIRLKLDKIQLKQKIEGIS